MNAIDTGLNLPTTEIRDEGHFKKMIEELPTRKVAEIQTKSTGRVDI